MNTNSRILLVGKICGEDFSWTVSPLPVEEQLTEEEVNRIIDVEQCAPEDMIQATIDTAHQDIFSCECDKDFDAPAPFSHFDHLVGSGHPPSTHDLWRRGYHAQRAGRALASMPDEYSECGWWAAYWHCGKYDGDGAVECDHDDIRRGGSGMGLF